MILSQDTITVLKNFATINSNLVIKEGNSISTISPAKDIIAEFVGTDKFDEKLALFNLNEFLGVLSAFEKPELVLDTKFLTIHQGKSKVKYVYADESLLTTPTKSIKFPKAEISFLLTAGIFGKLRKMAAILSAEDFVVEGDGETIKLQVMDKKNPTANSFEIDTEVATKDTFKIFFKIDKFKLVEGDYNMEISSKMISCLKHASMNLTVYIAVEKDSTFN